MAPRESASPSVRLLARELREWRERRHMLTRRVSATVGCGLSMLSRIENADHLIDADQLGRMLRLYQVPPDDQDRLRQLRRDALRETQDAQQDQHLAVEVLAWAPDAVPVALRTEPYARAVLASVRRVRRITPSALKAEISAIRDWQARLRGEVEGAPPLAVTCVVDEAVLTRRRGPTSAMLGQLDHLASLPAEVRVLPLDADGPALGPFTVLGYGDEFADVVLMAAPTGVERIANDEDAVLDARNAFEDLLAAAADVEESAAMIKRAADRWS